MATTNNTVSTTKTTNCPHCNSNSIVKMGYVKSNRAQRYKCKCCNRTFTDSTNKVTAHTQKSKDTWSKFIYCFMHKYTLRETANVCDINLHTAFDWRHKILDCLQNMQNTVTLSGTVESDETFFALSYKGKRKNMPRKSHKRGKSIHTRGLSGEQVCVVCSIDGDNKSIGRVATLGKPNCKAIGAVLDNRIDSNATLITDSHSSYKQFAKNNGLNLVQIESGRHTNGEYNIQKINSYHNELKRMIIGKFNGVATKYLNNYVVYHNFVNIVKESNKTEILENFLSTSFCLTKGYEIVNRNAIPVLV